MWCTPVAIFGAFLITIFGAYSFTDYSYIATGASYIILPIILAGSAVNSSTDQTARLMTASTMIGFTLMGVLTASTVNMVKYKKSTLFYLLE